MAASTSTPEGALQATAAGCRVLLVDDDESVRVTLGAVLQQKGYHVRQAATVQEARALLEDDDFEVMVADLRLDDGHTGLEMVSEALNRDPDLVTIILTAYVSTTAAVEALRGGATNFLAKPCSVDELSDAIEHGLEKRALLRELRQAREEAALRGEAEIARAEATRLYQELQQAHFGSELLANIGKELASSLDLDDLLERLVHTIVPAFADWCVLDVVEEGYDQRVAVAHVDPTKEELAREIQRRFPPISAEGNPMRQVLDTGEPRYVPEYGQEQASTDGVDAGAMELVRQLAPQSVISVPLRGRRGSLGVMSFLHSESGRRFAPRDVELAQEIANRAGMAIENAQLFRDTERAAERRQRLAERQRFLAEASRLLDSSLEYEVTLQQLADLMVPALADWCSVDVPEKGRFGQSLAIAHADPAKVTLARQLQQRWPADMEADTGLARIMRTGEPQFVPEITQQMMIAGARDEEHLRLISSLGPWCSGMGVPLNARGKTLGVMTLITAESGRRYTEEDLAFAMDVANRAAVAVDNARLYAAEQRARREAERLQALTEKLGQSMTPEIVLDQIAEMAAELLDAPVAGVFLIDQERRTFVLSAGRGLDLSSPLELPHDRSFASHIIATGKAEAIGDVAKGPLSALPALVSREPVGSLVVAPIISSAGPLGVVEVYSAQTEAFEQHHADLLAGLAGAAAAVLENARLYRQSELALARLQTIVEQLPVGIVVVEAPTGMVSLTNRQAEQLYGRPLRDLKVGAHDQRQGFHASGEAYALDEWPLARALNQGEVVNTELIEIERPDGGRSHLSVNAAPIRDGQGRVVAAVAVFDDVSDEEELRRQKEQFLAAAAHDLKTPLTTIRGMVQLLSRQLGRAEEVQPERLARTIASLNAATSKMNGLIEELLDVSRLESTGTLSLNRDETDLVAVARAVIESYSGGYPEHRLEFETSSEQVIGYWDAARLERAISNLVGNAIKYSPEGGTVWISISQQQADQGEEAVVSVRDEGIGIPSGDLGRIFDRFQRGSNVPEKLSGSGIGLSYVRQVVLQHEGTIGVQSRPGEGTTFALRLPMSATR